MDTVWRGLEHVLLSHWRREHDRPWPTSVVQLFRAELQWDICPVQECLQWNAGWFFFLFFFFCEIWFILNLLFCSGFLIALFFYLFFMFWDCWFVRCCVCSCRLFVFSFVCFWSFGFVCWQIFFLVKLLNLNCRWLTKLTSNSSGFSWYISITGVSNVALIVAVYDEVVIGLPETVATSAGTLANSIVMNSIWLAWVITNSRLFQLQSRHQTP